MVACIEQASDQPDPAPVGALSAPGGGDSPPRPQVRRGVSDTRYRVSHGSWLRHTIALRSHPKGWKATPARQSACPEGGYERRPSANHAKTREGDRCLARRRRLTATHQYPPYVGCRCACVRWSCDGASLVTEHAVQGSKLSRRLDQSRTRSGAPRAELSIRCSAWR